jgi:hypothetical protein
MTDLNYIEPAVSLDLIRKELTTERFLRKTGKGDNEIYVVNHHNSPNIVKEIGRLRELTFASAGGGTGKPIDLDDFDTGEHVYEQLILWAPESQEIIGGYRFQDCSKICNIDPLPLSTANYFKISETFKKEYLPHTIELGRSWIQPNFQATAGNRKGIFALDNLWDGLGALTIIYPHIKYFYGKMTLYSSYNQVARDALLTFLAMYFPDEKNLVIPHKKAHIPNFNHSLIKEIEGIDYKEAHKKLSNFIRGIGENIPPLFNSYMGLSPTMKYFGTAFNPDFGAVEESGILVTINDIYPEKRERHQKL